MLDGKSFKHSNITATLIGRFHFTIMIPWPATRSGTTFVTPLWILGGCVPTKKTHVERSCSRGRHKDGTRGEETLSLNVVGGSRELKQKVNMMCWSRSSRPCSASCANGAWPARCSNNRANSASRLAVSQVEYAMPSLNCTQRCCCNARLCRRQR